MHSRYSPRGTIWVDSGPLSPDPADRSRPLPYLLYCIPCRHSILSIQTMAVARICRSWTFITLARLGGLRHPHLLWPRGMTHSSRMDLARPYRV